jgi:GNAT superfamily N-acetyltransferase
VQLLMKRPTFILISLSIGLDCPVLGYLTTFPISYSSVFSRRNLRRLVDVDSDLATRSQIICPEPQWNYYLVDYSDLTAISDVTLDCFYQPRFHINTSNMSNFEKSVWQTFFQAVDVMDRWEVKLGNYLGFLSRSGSRLIPIYSSIEMNGESIILAALPKNHSVPLDQRDSPPIEGIVELCLERGDGKLTDPIRSPFADWIAGPRTEAYICNLCIVPSARRKGLGTSLVRLCEDIAQTRWGKNVVYLHVETKNEPGQRLYLNLGYLPVTHSMMTPWERKLNGLEGVLYYAKNLS